jgi:hypothetical protein
MTPSTAAQWTEWVAISEAESSDGPFANKIGVYQICAIDSGGSNAIRIPRLGCEDPGGLLYIGHSTRSIAGRVKIFRTIHPPYLLACTKLPKHELQVRVKLLPASEAYDEEQKELVKYGTQFGESPPCNRNAAR